MEPETRPMTTWAPLPGGERRVAVASEKGGVGKTTLVLNLGLALARRGWRTLIVDTDPQGAISLSLNREVGATAGISELALGAASFDDVVVGTKLPELSFVPCGRARTRIEEMASGLDTLLAGVAGRFDLVLFDTASGLGDRTETVLRRVSSVLVPVQAEPLSLRTLQGTLDGLSAIREETGLGLLGIVLTMVQSRDPISLATVQEIWNRLPPEVVLDGFLPRDPVFLKASAHGVPVQLLSRRRPPAVASVFDRLAAEVESRLGLEHPGEDDVVPLVD
jgi:chromosome partitioning protein